MKNLKHYAAVVAVVAVVAILTTAGAVFAAEIKTPVESGKLDEFKAQMLEQKKAILDQRVAEEELTREEADEIYEAMKENIASCDGSGSAGIGRKYGAGFGNGFGCGAGIQAGGMGMSRGRMGTRMGFGRR